MSGFFTPSLLKWRHNKSAYFRVGKKWHSTKYLEFELSVSQEAECESCWNNSNCEEQQGGEEQGDAQGGLHQLLAGAGHPHPGQGYCVDHLWVKIKIDPNKNWSGGSRIDRGVVTSQGVVNISHLALSLRRSARRGECCILPVSTHFSFSHVSTHFSFSSVSRHF